MKISYDWLKEYIDTDFTPEQLDQVLTDTGLEVEGLDPYESIKGGLKGIVVGEVLEKSKHPNADKLNCTKVNVGEDEPLSIVCGAPNVEAGQKVVVATIGTELYSGDESFTIKKSKIRGELSQGMICAEDEIGLGESHAGIMVLDANAVPGSPASEYFGITNDTVIEIGLTPNRADAMGHIGVARDIAAYLQSKGQNAEVKFPSTADFKEGEEECIPIEVENTESCPRYAGIVIKGIKVAPSPEWMQHRLKAIGLNPINNIVDITNYVLHEYGQPLHAFDLDKIGGQKVVVKNMPAGSKFVTLDEKERELHENDLMICDAEKGMCIAGVFGGMHSGISDETVNVFLESAYFDPVSIRKSSKRHGLKTDASFRFERGVDPLGTIEVLKRAAMLITEIGGGKIASKIGEVYPKNIEPFRFDFSIEKCHKVLGYAIPKEEIITILNSLEIKVTNDAGDVLSLEVPPYRVDVQREIDVIEDILRIYGYNNIPLPGSIKMSVVPEPKPDPEKMRNSLSDYLTAKGYTETLANSLTQPNYWEGLEDYQEAQNISLLNPLSSELSTLRRNLVFGALESVQFNQNRQQNDLRLYEFGKVYWRTEEGMDEKWVLGITLAGARNPENWIHDKSSISFYDIKGIVDHLIQKLGLSRLKYAAGNGSIFSDSIVVSHKKKTLVEYGVVQKQLADKFDLRGTIYFAQFDFELIVQMIAQHKIAAKPIVKFPAVRRDLSLLLDSNVTFADLEQLAFECDRKLLKNVNLFDVYEGKNLSGGKKSYALSFMLQDENKTLEDKQIDKVMNKIIKAYEEKLGAALR